MAKSPRGRKAAVNTEAFRLVEALAFVGVASRDTGEGPWQTHCQFQPGQVVAFDGLVSAGHPVTGELACCPHTEKLKAAISKVGASLSLTLLESGNLSVKGDKLRALVPTLGFETMPPVEPDPVVAPLNDSMKAALACVGTLVKEGEDEMLKAALLISGGTAQSTNRQVALQYWHGIDFPPGVVVPKLFAQAVCRQILPLTGFGVSWRQNLETGAWQPKSVTFHFENGAWIKTLCYADPYPDFASFMDVQSYPVEAPAGLFEAVETVKAVTENNRVYFEGDRVQSHESDQVGAQYDVPGLVGGKCFDPALLMKAAPFVKTYDITTYPDRMLFFGDNVRGVVMGCTK